MWWCLQLAESCQQKSSHPLVCRLCVGMNLRSHSSLFHQPTFSLVSSWLGCSVSLCLTLTSGLLGPFGWPVDPKSPLGGLREGECGPKQHCVGTDIRSRLMRNIYMSGADKASLWSCQFPSTGCGTAPSWLWRKRGRGGDWPKKCMEYFTDELRRIRREAGAGGREGESAAHRQRLQPWMTPWGIWHSEEG